MPPRFSFALVATSVADDPLLVRVGDRLLQPRGVLVRERQRRVEEIVRRLDAILEGRVGVGLAEQPKRLRRPT